MSCAFGLLGKVDDIGCYALRVEYDLNGEHRRNAMEEVRSLLKKAFCLIRLNISLTTFYLNFAVVV